MLSLFAAERWDVWAWLLCADSIDFVPEPQAWSPAQTDLFSRRLSSYPPPKRVPGSRIFREGATSLLSRGLRQEKFPNFYLYDPTPVHKAGGFDQVASGQPWNCQVSFAKKMAKQVRSLSESKWRSQISPLQVTYPHSLGQGAFETWPSLVCVLPGLKLVLGLLTFGVGAFSGSWGLLI